MKAISVSSDSVGVLGLPKIRLYADSAIGRDTMPLFIPDILGDWRACVCPAWRIERLGKNIPARFARRYADAMSMVLVLRPGIGEAEFLDSGACAILDSMVTTGRWLDIPDTDAPLSIEVCDKIADLTAEAIDITPHISAVSRIATIKSGDIIILSDCAVEVPLQTNTYITAKINGNQCLNVKVK